MRALDDILFGFLIFFAIDRLIRLITNAFIEPMAEKSMPNKNQVENVKLGSELFLLLVCIFLVHKYRFLLAKLNTR